MREINNSAEQLEIHRPTEQAIVENIFLSRTMETEVGGSRVYIMRYGSKELEVYFDFTSSEVGTYVENIKTESRILNETTLLYTAAKKVIDSVVQETGRTFTYSLDTPFPRMKKWAETKGREIFDWEEEEEKTNIYSNSLEYPLRYIFRKRFCPEVVDQKSKLVA